MGILPIIVSVFELNVVADIVFAVNPEMKLVAPDTVPPVNILPPLPPYSTILIGSEPIVVFSNGGTFLVVKYNLPAFDDCVLDTIKNLVYLLNPPELVLILLNCHLAVAEPGLTTE